MEKLRYVIPFYKNAQNEITPEILKQSSSVLVKVQKEKEEKRNYFSNFCRYLHSMEISRSDFRGDENITPTFLILSLGTKRK